jgi:hypothetical protein
MILNNTATQIDATLQVGFDATGQPMANVNGEKPAMSEIIQRVHIRREQLLRELALETAWLVAIGQSQGRIVVPSLVVPRT